MGGGRTLTQAHGLICICLEARVTKAIEASHCVDALPVAAYVGDFLTLIAICKPKATWVDIMPICMLSYTETLGH